MTRKRTRVLHVIDTHGPGGAETVCLNLVMELDKTRFEIIPVVDPNSWLLKKLSAIGKESIRLKGKGRFNLAYLFRLIELVRKYDINIIHSHLLGCNVYCSMVGLLTRVPVISTFHGYVDAGNSALLPLKFQLINRGSNKIVFVSNHLKEHFINTWPIDAALTRVIYNGVDLRRFYPGSSNKIRKRLGLKTSDTIVGSIGNIRWAKRYDRLLSIAASVSKRDQSIKFVIAGEGTGTLMDELLVQRKELSLEKIVFFVGFQPDITEFLWNLDIFFLPSSSEGFSLSTIEAMACGLPVIVTKSGGPEEIVLRNESGFVIDGHDEGKLVEAILKLSRDPQLRRKLGASGRQRVKAEFQLAVTTEKYMSLYEEVIAQD